MLSGWYKNLYIAALTFRHSCAAFHQPFAFALTQNQQLLLWFVGRRVILEPEWSILGSVSLIVLFVLSDQDHSLTEQKHQALVSQQSVTPIEDWRTSARARLKLSALNTRSDSAYHATLSFLSVSVSLFGGNRETFNEFLPVFFKARKLYSRVASGDLFPTHDTPREVCVREMEETSRQKLHSHTRAAGAGTMSYQNMNWLQPSCI